MSPDLVKINTEEATKKLTVLRHYFFEILLIVFAIAIVFLFNGQRKLEVDMRKYLNEDRRVLIERVAENTAMMKEIKELLIANRNK